MQHNNKNKNQTTKQPNNKTKQNQTKPNKTKQNQTNIFFLIKKSKNHDKKNQKIDVLYDS